MWKKLNPCEPGKAKEETLQSVFDGWPAPGWKVAGGPAWLFERIDGKAVSKFPAYGCQNEPDVYWRQGSVERVIELKLAAKYEPLALAQVLYYKHLLLELNPACVPGKARIIRPTVVSSYSPWLRAARHVLASERKGGLGLDCLEVDVLEQNILWFDVPAARWASCRPPRGLLPPEYRQANWYFVEPTRTWFGVRHPERDRPVLMTQPYVMVTELRTSAGAKTGESVLWQGTPPRKRAARGSRAWVPSIYRHYCPGEGALDLTPPWSEGDHSRGVTVEQCPNCG